MHSADHRTHVRSFLSSYYPGGKKKFQKNKQKKKNHNEQQQQQQKKKNEFEETDFCLTHTKWRTFLKNIAEFERKKKQDEEEEKKEKEQRQKQEEQKEEESKNTIIESQPISSSSSSSSDVINWRRSTVINSSGLTTINIPVQNGETEREHFPLFFSFLFVFLKSLSIPVEKFLRERKERRNQKNPNRVGALQQRRQELAQSLDTKQNNKKRPQSTISQNKDEEDEEDDDEFWLPNFGTAFHSKTETRQELLHNKRTI